MWHTQNNTDQFKNSIDCLTDNTDIILYIILINYYYKGKQTREEMLVANYVRNTFLSRETDN